MGDNFIPNIVLNPKREPERKFGRQKDVKTIRLTYIQTDRQKHRGKNQIGI